jgi:hypothetical protein
MRLAISKTAGRETVEGSRTFKQDMFNQLNPEIQQASIAEKHIST